MLVPRPCRTKANQKPYLGAEIKQNVIVALANYVCIKPLCICSADRFHQEKTSGRGGGGGGGGKSRVYTFKRGDYKTNQITLSLQYMSLISFNVHCVYYLSHDAFIKDHSSNTKGGGGGGGGGHLPPSPLPP